MKRGVLVFMALLVGAALSGFGAPQAEPGKAAAAPAKILWWSHWANEPSKVSAIEKIAADYMVAHPNVKIEIVWWDKNPLRDAFRAAMTAGGKEAADIVTQDDDLIGQLADAGWIVPLDALPKDRFVSGAVEGGTYKGKLYKFNIGKSLNMVFYNRELMKQLGIAVPASNQFTSQEYLDTVRKAVAAGYSGTANAIGNRPHPAQMVAQNLCVTMFTADEWTAYWTGRQSWDTPQMRELLNYYDQLGRNGFWPATFTTMTIDEYHVYFHTQRKSLYLWVPSWYTGRAFKAEDQGGQSPNFRFGMLLLPRLPGAKYPGNIGVNFESGYAVTSANPKNSEVAIDILRFTTLAKYGAIWEAYTQIPAAIKNAPVDRPADIPAGPWVWYTEETARVYGAAPATMTSLPSQSGDLINALKVNINEGIPQKLVTVDQAIANINKVIGK